MHNSVIHNASENINDYIETLPTKHKFLKNYQYIILQYFLSEHFADKQLLLLWLAVGRGKTLLSLACAIAGIDKGMFKRVVVLCPKAIIDEFEKNLKLYFELMYSTKLQHNCLQGGDVNELHKYLRPLELSACIDTHTHVDTHRSHAYEQDMVDPDVDTTVNTMVDTHRSHPCKQDMVDHDAEHTVDNVCSHHRSHAYEQGMVDTHRSHTCKQDMVDIHVDPDVDRCAYDDADIHHPHGSVDPDVDTTVNTMVDTHRSHACGQDMVDRCADSDVYSTSSLAGGMTSKSKPNAEQAYQKYKSHFHMIAYNSWKAYHNFRDLYKSTKGLSQTLFIIDEAHLFMKSIIKVNLRVQDERDSAMKFIGNAKRIYDIIQSISRKKVLVLTGTPSAKTPFETIPMFNLAYKQPLFTSNYQEFNDKYIDYEEHKVVHVTELRKKLDGLIAYVPAVSNKSSPGTPHATELKVINVEMSKPQYQQYLIDYEKELNEGGFTNKRNIFGLMFGSISTFHTKTFEDCIYFNPYLNNRNGENRYKGKLIVDKIHCPKIVKMYNDTTKIKGSCVFYFRFARMYGIECMEEMLKMNGYTKVVLSNYESVFDSKAKRYIVFSGNEDIKFRDRCKESFNDSRNRYGEYMKYMILSPSGSVGITLKNVRYLGIGSVSFNYSEVRQIMGRVNRLNSHADLPAKDRTVTNYIYVMVKNKEYYEKHRKFVDALCERTSVGITESAPTIEKIILYDSYEDDKINESFRNDVLIPASITANIYDEF